MENKINIAELLKDCPKGMELDCAMYENVTLFCASDSGAYPIKIETPDGLVALDKYGCYSSNEHAKCVIFPKGKTTWEGFVPPCRFKDGDIVTCKDGGLLAACIYKERKNPACFSHHIALYKGGLGIVVNGENALTNDELRLATKDEQQKLFDAIKENGYRWNFQAKRLEELITPIFKKGDKIQVRNGVSEPRIIDDVCDTFYTLVPIGTIDFTEQNRWELVPDKLIKPNFRVGDIIQDEDGYKVKITKVDIDEEYYEYLSMIAKGIGSIPFKYQNEWNLVSNKAVGPKFKVGDVIINIYRKYLNCDSKGGKISKIIDDKYIFDTGSYTHIQCQDNYELVSNKLVEPKFKVGDKIVQKNSACTTILITNVGDEFYYSNTESSVGVLPISEQDDWELVSNKFDINTLVPFESKVLCRDNNTEKWKSNFWGFYDNGHAMNYPFECCGTSYGQCIPYEGNEHLLGTTDDCNEFYKTWE